jgi:hypothetical protein
MATATHRGISEGVNLRLSGSAIRRACAVMWLANACLIVVTLLSDLEVPVSKLGIVQQFDLKFEGNIAVWYSSLLLFFDGLLALAIANTPPPPSLRSSWYRGIWLIAALFFIGLSADEMAQLHETLGYIFTKRFGGVPGFTTGLPGSRVFVWVLLLLPLILAFMVVTLLACRWWLMRNRRSRNLALLALGCWVGVICAELVQAQLARWSLQRSFQGVVEEGLEVTGASLFMMAFVEFLRSDLNRPPA